jgi:hypothetical protein
MGLESEYQHHPKGQKEVLMDNLQTNALARKRSHSCFAISTDCGRPAASN